MLYGLAWILPPLCGERMLRLGADIAYGRGKFRPAARTPEEQAETAGKVDYCLLRMTAEIIFLSGAGDFHKMKAIDWLYIAINSFIYNHFRRRRLHFAHLNSQS